MKEREKINDRFFFLKLVECSIQMLIMDLYLVEYNFFGAFRWRLYLIHGTCKCCGFKV